MGLKRFGLQVPCPFPLGQGPLAPPCSPSWLSSLVLRCKESYPLKAPAPDFVSYKPSKPSSPTGWAASLPVSLASLNLKGSRWHGYPGPSGGSPAPTQSPGQSDLPLLIFEGGKPPRGGGPRYRARSLPWLAYPGPLSSSNLTAAQQRALPKYLSTLLANVFEQHLPVLSSVCHFFWSVPFAKLKHKHAHELFFIRSSGDNQTHYS